MKNQDHLQIQSSTYLDFNASTPLHPEVIEKMPEVLSHFGNPSSIHWAGRESKSLLRNARENIAKLLGVQSLEIVFTSGGSESNSTVLQRIFANTKNSTRNEIITSNIEHPSISQTLQSLKHQGCVVHEVKVNRAGEIDWTYFESVLSDKTALVTMMMANNETGIILPIQEIAAKAHSVGAKMHVDAVQALGKIPVDLKVLNVDFASFSAHKFYALKGTGVLFVKKGNDLGPLIFGGGQERKRRGGTENSLGIWAFGKMAEKTSLIPAKSESMKILRDLMEARILSEIPHIKITHKESPRLPNTSSIIIQGVDGDTLLMSLDVQNYAVSTGSACSSGRPEPSEVLRNLGLSHSEAQSSLRVSLGWETTEEQIHKFVETLKNVVGRLRKIEVTETERQHEARL